MSFLKLAQHADNLRDTFAVLLSVDDVSMKKLGNGCRASHG